MAIALRATWQGTQAGTNRNVFVDVTTIAGDFLLAWHPSQSSSGSTTIYDYDSDGTDGISTGTPMDFVGEYARGAGTEIALVSFNPNANLGTKKVHFYKGAGMNHACIVMAFTGVNLDDPVGANALMGIHFSGNQDYDLTAAEGDWSVIGFHSQSTNGVQPNGVGEAYLMENWIDDGDRHDILYEPWSAGATIEMDLIRIGGDSSRSGWGIVLQPKADAGVRRSAMFFSLAGLAIPAATVAALYKDGAVAL